MRNRVWGEMSQGWWWWGGGRIYGHAKTALALGAKENIWFSSVSVSAWRKEGGVLAGCAVTGCREHYSSLHLYWQLIFITLQPRNEACRASVRRSSEHFTISPSRGRSSKPPNALNFRHFVYCIINESVWNDGRDLVMLQFRPFLVSTPRFKGFGLGLRIFHRDQNRSS